MKVKCLQEKLQRNATWNMSQNSILCREAPLPSTLLADVLDRVSIEDEQNEAVPAYVKGWRLYLLTIGWVHFSSFLSAVEFINRFNADHL